MMFSAVGLPVPLSVTVRVFCVCTVDTEPSVVPWTTFVLFLILAARTLRASGRSALGSSTFDTLANLAGRPVFCEQVMVVSNR